MSKRRENLRETILKPWITK